MQGKQNLYFYFASLNNDITIIIYINLYIIKVYIYYNKNKHKSNTCYTFSYYVAKETSYYVRMKNIINEKNGYLRRI